MTLTVNVPQLIARARKARKLAAWLYDADWRPESIEHKDDAWWADKAQRAGVRMPSETTRQAVRTILAVITYERCCKACMGDESDRCTTCLGTGRADVVCPYCGKDGPDYRDPDDNGRAVHRECVEQRSCIDCGGPRDPLMTPQRYCEATGLRCGRCSLDLAYEEAALRGAGL